jgi:hypothetical protein
MTFPKKTAVLFLLIVFGVGANAQPNSEKEITDNEISKFVTSVQHIQHIEMEMQQQMVGELEKENMEVDRFNEIIQSQQDPESGAKPATEEEIIVIQKITQNFERIQMETQNKMIGKIEETGLTVERYQEIMAALQTDPELQSKVQESMQN